jgi:Ca2+-binding EF-hand superfamily protein
MLDKDNLKCLFPSGDGDRLTVEEFNKMVDEAENSSTITYEEFKKEVDEWLERRMEK